MAATIIAPEHKKRTADRLPELDVAALTARLKRKIKGEVRFDDGSRALYATDASNYRQVPIGVVLPRDDEDVLETLAACREVGAPILCRGGGTSLAGQCCNVAVVMDFTKYMRRVIGVDTRNRLARVQPGCVLDDLRAQIIPHRLNFGPDPATHSHCAIGGMLGNNSCGVHSLLRLGTESPAQARQRLATVSQFLGAAPEAAGAPGQPGSVEKGHETKER